MSTITKKYRINDELAKLSVADYKRAITALPLLLEISIPTFNNYRNIALDDAQDIPHTLVCCLEQFFSLPPNGLQNFKTNIRTLTDLQNFAPADTEPTKRILPKY